MSMKEKFSDIGLDWDNRGYFGCPDPPQGLTLPPDPALDPWGYWIFAFHRAKRGDFSFLPVLKQILTNSADWLLVATCSDLVGDAGTNAAFDSLLEALRQAEDFPRAREICNALYLRGKLSDAAVLLKAYQRFSSFKDADILPVWISDLLESEDGPLSEPTGFEDLEDYGIAVQASVRNLVEQFGSDQVYVFRRKRFGVVSLAKDILERVRQPFARSILRHKFEASTGIDCTSFYKSGELQALTAAAIIEDFLESTEAAKYQEGVRFFFGHRIPA
jgi:hypothetical protein